MPRYRLRITGDLLTWLSYERSKSFFLLLCPIADHIADGFWDPAAPGWRPED